MRVNNRVTQVPPLRTHEPRHHEVTEKNNHTTPTTLRPSGGPSQGGNSVGGASGSCSVASRGDGGEGSSGGSSSHGTGRRAGGSDDRGAEATRTTMSPATHMAATMPATELKRFIAERLLKQVTAMASPPSPLDFATYFSQRNSSFLGSPSTTRSKTQFSGLGATHYPLKTPVATTTRSASTSPSAWTRHHSLGSSHSTRTLSTSGTSSRLSSPATSQAQWGARVLAWFWQWSRKNKARRYASTCGASSTSARP
jgi:hypothetical protein